MTTKELAKKDETSTALALPAGYMEDFPEGYDEADHVLPWFSIVQPSSGSEKKALGKEGTFVSKNGTNYETLRFVLLWTNYGRGKKRPNEEDGSMFICQSEDRKAGRTSEPERILTPEMMTEWNVKPGQDFDIPCELCPLHDDEKNWVKNGSRYTYTLRCWDLEAGQPFVYFVHGAAMASIRAVIIDRVTPRPTKSGVMPPEKPFWWAEIEMSTQHKEDKGSYYVPIPRIVKELTEEEVVQYVSQAPMVRRAIVEEPDEFEGKSAENGEQPVHPGLGSDS